MSGPFLRFETQALGTQNVLVLGGACEDVIRRAAQEAFETLDRLERALSKFIPTSDVGLLNALGADRPVRLGGHAFRLLELAREAWELTGGAFDPTVGALLHAWGLVEMEGRVPPAEEIENLLAARGMDHVVLDSTQGTARFDRPGVSVDLGAIGKGYAVDVVVQGVRAHGIPSGSFSSGRSSIVAWGSPPGGGRWTFDVAHPVERDADLCTLEVEPGAVSTSAASERRFFLGGKEYGHVLDPRTGRPARGALSATAWTENALLGDVLTTAAFVLGSEAIVPGGVAERLVRAWTPAGKLARASVLLALGDPGRWGGLRLEAFHIGEPAFTLALPAD